MPKRVMMAVGGTGGHIYPACALAEQITSKDDCIDILFAGGHLKNNPYFNKLQWPYENISCGPFNSKNPMKLGSSLSLNLQGVYESIKIIKKFKPSLIIGFGSYHSLPTLLAAKLCSVPLMLFASDCHPGKVIRLFSRFSTTTAIQFEEAAGYLKGNVKVVNMPLRKGMKKNSVTPAEAKGYYQLDENTITLLVFGGSQGAAAINTALCQVIESKGHDWVDKLQIIHMAGKEEFCAHLQHMYKKAGIKSCVKAFEDRMDMAWQACDFVLSRAGAASMAEQIEFEVPGILIPYPHAAENHQEKNGKVMKYRIGAADVIVEKEMTPERLFETISKFIDVRGHVLQQMKSALKEYKRKRQALDLSDLVLDNLYAKSD